MARYIPQKTDELAVVFGGRVSKLVKGLGICVISVIVRLAFTILFLFLGCQTLLLQSRNCSVELFVFFASVRLQETAWGDPFLLT
jgi:hypothetical protein